MFPQCSETLAQRSCGVSYTQPPVSQRPEPDVSVILDCVPLLSLPGSSLQEYDPLSGQSICQALLLRTGSTHSVSAQSDVTFSGVQLHLVSRVCFVSQVCSVSQVSVPKDLVAVMSAVRDGQEVDPEDNNRIVYRFRQPVSPLFFTTVLMMRKMLILDQEVDGDQQLDIK